MATTIKATCNLCNADVRIPHTAVTIRTQEGEREGRGQYRFICPECGKIVLKEASDTIIQLLRDARVREEYYELPLELLERPLNGTLSADDLIDLGMAFEDGSAFDKITRKNQQ